MAMSRSPNSVTYWLCGLGRITLLSEPVHSTIRNVAFLTNEGQEPPPARDYNALHCDTPLLWWPGAKQQHLQGLKTYIIAFSLQSYRDALEAVNPGYGRNSTTYQMLIQSTYSLVENLASALARYCHLAGAVTESSKDNPLFRQVYLRLEVNMKDAEFQEHDKFLSPDFLSVAQITEILAEDIDGVQQKFATFLNFKNLKTCLKEAILVDYYVSGFLWARGMDFSVLQYSKFMTLLDVLLHNLRALHMSLKDSLQWLGEVMAEIGPAHLQKHKKWSIFDIKQANAITDYLKISLFQHYKLYEFLFYSSREEIVLGAEQMIEVVKSSGGLFPNPLEEGISFDIYSTFIEPPPALDTEMKILDQEQGSVETQPAASTSETDALAGLTIEDIKSVLAQVTDDILIGIQAEINEKLQIQEEAFNARIEKLKKA
ncbi:PREDICTED: uncharacterized protein C10orf107 homolog [Myotis davidii]|nr:PREDICTED: uncharacterized protein C10orf107 homolog [Myotis davidii]